MAAPTPSAPVRKAVRLRAVNLPAERPQVVRLQAVRPRVAQAAAAKAGLAGASAAEALSPREQSSAARVALGEVRENVGEQTIGDAQAA
jgi:hypothetical protein